MQQSFSSEEENDDDDRRTRRAPRRRRDRSFRRSNENDNGDDNDDDDEEDSVTGNWSIDGDPNNNHDEHARAPSATNRNTTRMTVADIAMCQALDLEYERALEDRQVAWSARYQSVRQSTLFSVVFMVLLILTGTAFFLRQADSYWSVSEGLLFTIYTITTVGYGHLDMPGTPAFQIYTCFFIFLGIAMLTILVAQVYQCIALEASRVASSLGGTEQQPHRRRNGMRLWLEARMREQRELNQHEQQQRQQQQSSSMSHVDVILCEAATTTIHRDIPASLGLARLARVVLAKLGPIANFFARQRVWTRTVGGAALCGPHCAGSSRDWTAGGMDGCGKLVFCGG